MRDYKESISANNSTWKAEARRLMESGAEFVVVHLRAEDFPSCKGLAQEFDYDLSLEDKYPRREEMSQEYPAKLPPQLGFVKRGSLK
jgi:hypothetical protein